MLPFSGGVVLVGHFCFAKAKFLLENDLSSVGMALVCPVSLAPVAFSQRCCKAIAVSAIIQLDPAQNPAVYFEAEQIPSSSQVVMQV